MSISCYLFDPHETAHESHEYIILTLLILQEWDTITLKDTALSSAPSGHLVNS